MYTTFTQTPEGLRIELTSEAKEEMDYLLERKDQIPYGAFWWELNEGQFCNGYSEVRPEDIGALTDGPIIADGFVGVNTTKEEFDNTKFWWFSDYMIRDEVEELLTKGFVVFPPAE